MRPGSFIIQQLVSCFDISKVIVNSLHNLIRGGKTVLGLKKNSDHLMKTYCHKIFKLENKNGKECYHWQYHFLCVFFSGDLSAVLQESESSGKSPGYPEACLEHPH